MILRALVVAIVLCTVPLHSRAGQAPPRAADAGSQQTPPLSPEDADVVKELALLQDVELLQNLELFEEKAPDAAQTPDAGTPDAGTPTPRR
jgi:hypothetical protein